MANDVEIMTNAQMANALQGSLDANAMQVSGNIGCAGSAWQSQLGYYYPQYIYCGCSHSALEKDEDLLLNVVRRNPKIKTKVLKVALAALLADLERSKEKASA
jgi:hypothetical protein